MADEHNDNWATAGYIAALIIILIVLVTEVGRGLDLNYVYGSAIFFGIGIFGIVIIALLPKFFDTDDNSYQPTLFHETFFGDWTWAARGIAALVLIIAFAAVLIIVNTGTTTQHSVVPVVNPYDASKLVNPAKDLFSAEGTTISAVRTGTYAGIGEDTVGYIFVASITFLQLLLWKKVDEDSFSNIGLIALSIIIACAGWALVFSTAHSAVYGLDSAAYYSAASYGFTSQLVNAIVGAPVSILAHFAHNVIVVLGFSIALSIVSTHAILLTYRRHNRMKLARKGNALLIIGVIAVILLIIGAGAYYATNGKTLSVLQPGCTDFQNIPGDITCSTNADCAKGAIASDPNINTRCEIGRCQACLNARGGQ